VIDIDGRVVDWIDSMPGFRVTQLDKTEGIVAMPLTIQHFASTD
jgi:hypothetical protein